MTRVETKIEDLLITVKMQHEDLKQRMESANQNYVTRHEFRPVRLIAYGLVGTTLTAVLLSLVYLVIGI